MNSCLPRRFLFLFLFHQPVAYSKTYPASPGRVNLHQQHLLFPLGQHHHDQEDEATESWATSKHQHHVAPEIPPIPALQRPLEPFLVEPHLRARRQHPALHRGQPVDSRRTTEHNSTISWTLRSRCYWQ